MCFYLIGSSDSEDTDSSKEDIRGATESDKKATCQG